jgi:imipenem/basic amino acid-specific outer membrane pore
MKLGKLSLVAVMALGTSAYAIENVKVNGEVKVIYQTSDVQQRGTESVDTGLFDNGSKEVLVASPYNGSSAGGMSATLGVTADLLKAVSAGAEVQVYSTLGLDSNVFNDNMVNAPHAQTGFTDGTTVAGSTFDERTSDASNISQLWLATTLGKTTVKAGRMELDTPLLFTEKWNIAKNTFEGAVAINTDLPNTTLVAAWVGKHNGHGSWNAAFGGGTGNEGGFLLAGSPGRTVDMNSFNTFYTDGAYAAGAVNKSIPNTDLQAWYYNVVNIAEAVWLQADTKIAGMVSLGAQYAQMNPKGAVDTFAGATLDDSKIFALKAGVDISGVNVYAAYSTTKDTGSLGFANTSTGDKTKIYTGDGSIYFDGVVTAPGVDTVKIGASTSFSGVKAAAAYVRADGGDNSKITGNGAFSGVVDGYDLSLSTNIGQLGLQAIYTSVNNDTDNTVLPGGGNSFYKGRDIDTLRLIASLKF